MSDDGSHERLYNPDGWGCPKDILAVLLAVVVLCSLGWWVA